ncbi:MAG: phosphoribosylanthranilate isomerase, partial [Candidatus Muiribacteriaceae bacterium]
CSALPCGMAKVGVFVNESEDFILNVSKNVGLDIIQLHGEESDGFIESIRKNTGLPVIKKFSDKDFHNASLIERCPADIILIDTFHENLRGGTGKAFDHKIVKDINRRRVMIAGGLNSENIIQVMTDSDVFGYDISSGGENEKGIKDDIMINRLFRKVREYERQIR